MRSKTKQMAEQGGPVPHTEAGLQCTDNGNNWKSLGRSAAATQTDLEGIALSEAKQRKINTARYHLHVESKKNKYNEPVNIAKGSRLTDTE